jgi:hypothetical protein
MKQYAVAVIAVVAACAGGIAVGAYYETSGGRPEADEALVSLSNHATIIGLVETGDTRNAMRFLTALADADVMRLMSVESGPEASPAYRREVLTSYGEYRRKNPQFYAVPDYYVDQERRAEYEQNLKTIQTFLDGAAQSQAKSIK